MAVIGEILPPEVAVAESFGDIAGALLFPGEEAALGRAAARRRAEFATGRACAHTALARLGVPAAPILRGDWGNPRWPPAVVGSITHCTGYRACALARATDLAAIGIDAEPNNALPRGLLDVVAYGPEQAWVREHLTRFAGVCWDRLLFSAKEAVYKAWFPLTGQKLGFAGAIVYAGVTADPAAGVAAGVAADPAADAAAGTLDVRVPGAGPRCGVTGMAGRWLVRDGLIVTAITVPASGSVPAAGAV